MHKINKTFIVAIVVACIITPASAETYDTYTVSGINTFANVTIKNDGVNTFSDQEKSAILYGTKIWANTIKNLRPTYFYAEAQKGLDNARADSQQVNVKNSPYTMTQVNARLTNQNITSETDPIDGIITSDIGGFTDAPFNTSIIPTAIYHSNDVAYSIVIEHEIAHALGISISIPDTTGYRTEDSYTFPAKISNWDSNIALFNTSEDREISVEPGTVIKCENNETQPYASSSPFDVEKYAPYFKGETTIKVLGNSDNYDEAKINIGSNLVKIKGGADGWGLINYSYDFNKRLASKYGLPLDYYDGNLSHIDLRNSLMSHQNFRNWNTFMEAELAALKDIGYDIDLKKHFGQSYYLNLQTITNNNGYFKRNDNGTGYLIGTPSDVDYGIGLHIYGDNNDITQKADILSFGAGVSGARIEGVGNTFTLANGYKINTDGYNSLGIAVTYGKNHTITIDSGAEVTAKGENGRAVSFDFGDNIMGNKTESRGSYAYSEEEIDKTGKCNEIDVDGPLVTTFNLDGYIEGKDAAIYIAQNAYVQEININNGSSITGDILSEWTSEYINEYTSVQEADKFTTLNFDNYDKDFENNILGSLTNNTLIMNVSGNLGLKNSIVAIRKLINDGTINIKGTSELCTSDVSDSITGAGTINIQNDATLALGSGVQIIQNNINLDNATLTLANGEVAPTIYISNLNIGNGANLLVDIDYMNQNIDTINVINPTFIENAKLNLATNPINTSNLNTTETIEVPFINSVIGNTNLLGHITSETQIVDMPIYRYNSNYVETANSGKFVLTHPEGYEGFNPAIAVSSVAQQGMYLTQLNTYEQAFANMDMTMLMTTEQRTAWKAANKLATQDTTNGIITYSPNQFPEGNRGVWFRPFASFENVNLYDGPRADNISYGGLVGGDSDLITFKAPLLGNVDMIWGAYAGYNGSHQTYQGNGIYQNGGTLGLNAAFYWKNFFSGITANVGASVGDASTMYGKEYMTMFATGIAGKIGYNWEVFKGRFIVQPNLLMSTTFIHTFDYNNAAGVAMHDCSPLITGQLAPGLKFIGNLKHGWQPYANIQMMWNIMGKTKMKANDIHLSEMMVDPYIQYGVGLQKRWGDKFTGFGQVMLRNGGRTGVSLNAGFRYELGQNGLKTDKKASLKHYTHKTIRLSTEK